MNLAQYMESYYIEKMNPPKQLFLEDEIKDLKADKYKGWMQPETNEFFLTVDGTEHMDSKNIQKMKTVGWIDKPNREAAAEALKNDTIIRFAVDINSQEPIIIETGSEKSSEYFPRIAAMIRKKTKSVSKELIKTIKVLWDKVSGQRTIFDATGWLVTQ